MKLFNKLRKKRESEGSLLIYGRIFDIRIMKNPNGRYNVWKFHKRERWGDTLSINKSFETSKKVVLDFVNLNIYNFYL